MLCSNSQAHRQVRDGRPQEALRAFELAHSVGLTAGGDEDEGLVFLNSAVAASVFTYPQINRTRSASFLTAEPSPGRLRRRRCPTATAGRPRKSSCRQPYGCCDRQVAMYSIVLEWPMPIKRLHPKLQSNTRNPDGLGRFIIHPVFSL
jgi:hypothetical protein